MTEYFLERVESLEKALIDAQIKQQELKERNLILQTIFDNSTKAIFSLDTEHRYTSFNELHKINMKMIYGADIEIGKVALDYITNIEDRIYSEKNLARTLAGEYLAEEATYGTDELTRRYYFITHIPIKNEQHQIIGVAFTATDITDKKKAETKLKHTKELLERSNTAASVGTWEVDLETQKTVWSKMTRQIHEVADDFDTNVSNGILFYKAGESRTRITELVNQAIQYGTGFDDEFQIITAKGNEKWVRAIGLTEFENGQCVRLYGTFQDIDIRKKAELLIKQQNEELLATEEELRVNLDELIKIQANLEIQQQALLISEERYRKVVETQTDFVMLSTPDTSIVFANEPLANALGTTPSQMIGLKWIDFAMPEDIQFIAQKIEALTPEDNTFINENRDKRADGTWGWTQWIDQGLFDDKQNLIQLQSVGRDITLLKETQARLDGERQRFQNIVDSVDGIVWEADMDTFQFTYISQKAKRLLGYEIEEWYQADFWKKHLYSGDKDKVLDYHVAYSKNATSHEFEYRFVAKNGDIIWLRDITTVCQDENGLPILRGIMVDISESKKAEKELIIKQQAIETSIVPIALANLDGVLTYTNHAFEQTWGYEKNEAIGKHSIGFWQNPQEAFSYIEMLMAQGGGKGEMLALRKNGTTFMVELSVFMVFDAENQPICMMGWFMDITARKNAEQNIKIRIEQLNATLEYAPNVAIQWYDIDGKVLYWNKSSEIMYGWKAEEAVGKTLKELIHTPEEEEVFLSILQEITKTNQPYGPYEAKISHRNGAEGWVWATTFAIPIDEDKMGFVCMDVNITARKTMEAELHRLSLVAKRTSNIVIITDTDYKMTWVNEGFTRITGYSFEEALGKSPKMFQFEKTNPETIKLIGEKLSKKEAIRCEILNRGKNGRIYWLEIEIQPLRDEQGNHTGFMAIQSDITARKQMEDEIYRLSLVAKLTSNIVIITDKDNRMTWVNEAFTRITEYSFEEAIGKKPKILQFEETNPKTVHQIREKLSQAEPINCEILNKSKNGRIYWVEMEIQPLRDINGLHTGFMAIETDITARKKAKEELDHLIDITRNQNQRLSEYAYITSHNIRSSVANMMGLITFLHEEPQNPTYLEMMDSSIHQLDATIKTMNDLLDVEIETQTIEKQSVNLLEVVQNNIQLIQGLMRHVHVRIDIPEDMTLKVISVYLDSILNNLLSNAIKYCRNDVEPYIEIKAYRDEQGSIVLSVKDNGIGINLEKYRSKLFKMKGRLTTHVEGKGIGLFFTKHQIEAMGGKIDVESTPNEGTTFKVWFYQD